MNSKKEVKKKLEYFESFGHNHSYPMTAFKECMGAIALTKILKHYTSKKEVKIYIEKKLKENSKSVQENSANMRGWADGFFIQHCLWVLEAGVDDYFDKEDNYIREAKGVEN